MAPPAASSNACLRLATLILRILTFVFLLISLIILATNSATLAINLDLVKLKFKDVYAYRYMLFTIIIGIAYSLLQVAFTIYQMSMRRSIISGDGSFLFDFYADKIISYILATGAAAGFGATIDLRQGSSDSGIGKFFDKGSASASLVFFAFVCTAILSVFSSFALPKKV